MSGTDTGGKQQNDACLGMGGIGFLEVPIVDDT